VILTAKSEDTLVDPSYRGQKVFERMYELLFAECKKAGIQYIWGFTPAQKAFERIGFQVPYMAHQALLVFNPIKAFSYLNKLNQKNKQLDKLKIAGLTGISWVKGIKLWLTSSDGISYKVNSLNSDKTNVFQDFYVKQDLYLIRETTTYLNWRLIDNPFNNQYFNYQFFYKEGLIGDVIINIRKDVSYIEQFMIRDCTKASAITKILIHELKKHKVSLIRTLCFDINKELRDQSDSLTTAGFTYLERGMRFVWKPLDEANSLNPKQILLNRLFTQGNI